MKNKSDLFFFYTEKMGFLSSVELLNIFQLGMDMEEYLKEKPLPEKDVLKLSFMIFKHLLMLMAWNDGFVTREQTNHLIKQKLIALKNGTPPFSLLSLEVKLFPIEYLKKTLDKLDAQSLFMWADFKRLASSILILPKHYQELLEPSNAQIKTQQVQKDGKTIHRYEIVCKCGNHLIADIEEGTVICLSCGKCQKILLDLKSNNHIKTLQETAPELLKQMQQEQNNNQITNYQLLHKISESINGKLYLAKNQKSGLEFAIKTLDNQEKKTDINHFLDEMKTLAQLRHSNIVTIYEYGAHNGLAYYVMEYIEGGTLLELLNKTGKLHYQQSIKLIICVLNALVYANQQHLLHKDIKPANIFITKNGKIKLLELGIIKILERSMGVTQSSQMMGTPYYIAPEQLTNADNVNHQTDIYAVGAILYHCLCGLAPFSEHESSTVRLLMNKVKDNYIHIQNRNSKLPKQLIEIVNKSMASKLENRYQNAIDMKLDLMKFYQSVTKK